MDEGQINELLCTIQKILSRDFNVVTGAGVSSESAKMDDGAQGQIRKLVLVGASNLKKDALHLQSLGFEVLDLCIPGWLATPGSVSILIENLKKINIGTDVGFVLDLFGNNT